MRPLIRIFPDAARVTQELARTIAQQLDDAVSLNARVSLALSGGRTPRGLYQLLARDYRHHPDWRYVHVFWCDERFVPASHPDSNYRLVRETLLDPLGIPAANVHAVPTELETASSGALAYDQHLHDYFGEDLPRWDVVLLGMGDDGHTASLFPGSPAVGETTRWAVESVAPVEPRSRVTLTFPALLHARAIHVLVTGSSKRAAVARALDEPPDAARCPASGLRAAAGTVTWWLDEEAANARQDVRR
jgi:6-phosphogluconolactonase